MRLAQRETEWNTMVENLAAAERGEGRVVLVSGPGGTGRSELLAALGEHASERGAVTLTASCASSERGLAMGAIGQLFRSAALPERVRGLLERWVDDDRDALALARDLAAVLLDVATERTVVLVVDDLHDADEASLDVLLYLQRRITGVAVLIVLSEVQRRRVGHPRFHAELSKALWFQQIRLAPLSEAGVGEVLRTRLADEHATRFAAAWHRITGGNPVLVHALVEDQLALPGSGRLKAVGRPTGHSAYAELSEHTRIVRDVGFEDEGLRAGEAAAGESAAIESGGEDDPVLGTAFAETVLSCLHRWGPDLLAVARGIALLGNRASVVAISRLLDMETVSVDEAITELTATGLLHDGGFRHPAVHAVVRADLEPEGRVALHLKAAHLLHEMGAPSTDIGAQLLAAGGTVDVPWAAEVLCEAAREALSRREVARTTAYLELALRSASNEHDRAAAIALLARVRWLLNPSTITSLLTPLQDVMGTDHLGERDSVILSNYLLWRGEGDWVDRSGMSRHLLTRSTDPRSEAELYFTHQWLSFSHPGRLQEPPPDTAEPLSFSSRRLRRTLRLSDVMVHGASQEVVDCAEQVLQSCTLTDTMLESVLAALLTLVHGERSQRALHWCSVLGADARELGAKPWIAAIEDTHAYIALRRGDLSSAERLARSALRTMSAESWGVAIGSPISTLLLATTAMGKLDEADWLVKQPLPDSIVDARFWAQYLRGRGYYYLATNRLHAALADFETCGGLVDSWGLDLPAFLPWRSDAAQVHLALDRPDRARDLVNAQSQRPSGQSARVAGVSLRVLAGTCDLSQRPAMLGKAIGKLQESGAQLELALALAELGRAHHALGDSTRGRLTARRAKQIAKGCFAEWLCETVLPGDEPATPAVAAEGPDSFAILSEAERRVAILAAGGYTNREIGRKLFVTVSTVEQHLTRAYRKLNVNRRADLPAELPLAAVDTA
ncbi:AAA family ATPase [Saccharothrix isguenensis]